MAEEKLLAYSPAQIMPLLGLGRYAVYKAIKENRLPHIRLGRRIIIPVAALEKFMMDEAQPEQRAVNGCQG
jgi:excisionase family DNA binding protein